MNGLYVLNGKTPILADSLEAWGRWWETAERHVAHLQDGDIQVSTVFLVIDHGFNEPPLLFETMVFGGPLDMEQERCSTWEEAEQMHHDMVIRVTEAVVKEKS